MNHPTTVLANIKQFIPQNKLQSLVDQYNSDKYSKSFKTQDLLLTMLTAQAKGWESLREIETGFATYSNLLYHLGLSSPPAKSTISDANYRIPNQVFESIFYTLVKSVLPKIKTNKNHLNQAIKIIDSSLIELCITIFDWAKYMRRKGAIKLHLTLDLDSLIPEVVNISTGNTADIKSKNITESKFSDSIYILDRAYHDFDLFSKINKAGGYFVTRRRRCFKYEVIGQHRIQHKNILKDYKIRLTGDYSYPRYQRDLRLVEYYDEERDRTYRFLTNSFSYSAITICWLYKKRWEVEIFFKWIKQNLRIKTFFGTSENAVKTQIWIALIYYVLLRYIIYQCNYKGGILKLSRIIRETLFMRVTLVDILKAQNISQIRRVDDDVGQLAII